MTESTLSAALEDAEGKTLVEDILFRKKLRNARERFFQQLVWGDVQTDGHGNVIPRELPEHWKPLQQAAVAGGGVEYTRRLNRPDTVRIGGAMEGTRTAFAWLDEIHRQLHEKLDAQAREREALEKLLTEAMARPVAAPEIGSVCWSYRAHPPRPGTGAWFEAEASGIISGKSNIDQLVEKIRSIQLERARQAGVWP